MWKIFKRIKLKRLMKQLHKEMTTSRKFTEEESDYVKPPAIRLISLGTFLQGLNGMVDRSEDECGCPDCEYTISRTLKKKVLNQIDCEILMDADACSTGVGR